jgi:orotate phosphoribosyltransferase
MDASFQNEVDSMILRLWGAGAVQVNLESGITLKHNTVDTNAALSPIKLNLCTPHQRAHGTLTSTDMMRLGRLMWSHARHNGILCNGIAGVPNVGTYLAKEIVRAAYHEDGGKILCQVKLDKERGLTNVEHDLPRGEATLLVDDVITRGTSKMPWIELLAHERYPVHHCLVFADREQGGRDALANEGVSLHAVTTLSHILDLGEHDNLISAEDVTRIRDQIFA